MEDYHDPIPSEEELRQLAEDIVRYCPSLTQLLLALGKNHLPFDSVSPNPEPVILIRRRDSSTEGRNDPRNSQN